MKKIKWLGVALAACLSCGLFELQAQDITAQLLETVEREQERIKRSQLNLDDLLRLHKSKDIGYIDEYLENRGWKIEETNVGNIDEGGTCVRWAFDRSEYGGKKYARSWLEICVYIDTLYEIEYLIVNNELVDEIKADLKRKGYERVSSTSVIEKGLEYVYRDDEYEITLSKKRKEDGEMGADIGYNLYIRNYREEKVIEQMVIDAAVEKLAREAIIQQADLFYKQKQYDMAKSAYMELISTYPDQKENYEDILLKLDIEILCEEANSLLKNELYDEAKEKYLEALQIKSDYKKDFIQDEISEIDVMQKFLSERTYARYYYQAFEPEDYEAKNKYIEEQLKNTLLAINENVPEIRIALVGEVDTLGNSVFNYNMSVENDRLVELLGEVCRNLKLKKVEFNGYSAIAVAEFVYTIAHECQGVTLKKSVKGFDIRKISNVDQQTTIQQQMKTAPYGKYTFDLKSTSINGKYYNKNRLQKMRCVGGPENALLSLIIPGLGMHKVTYGKSIGLETMLPTYALLGGGIGFKVYSNKEYKKYHDATTQTEMDKHYKSANLANYAFYGCMLAGGLIWISDIIRVAVIGSQNLKKFNAYKHSYLGYYYNPEIEAMGLSYTIKF